MKKAAAFGMAILAIMTLIIGASGEEKVEKKFDVETEQTETVYPFVEETEWEWIKERFAFGFNSTNQAVFLLSEESIPYWTFKPLEDGKLTIRVMSDSKERVSGLYVAALDENQQILDEGSIAESIVGQKETEVSLNVCAGQIYLYFAFSDPSLRQRAYIWIEYSGDTEVIPVG